MLGCMEVPERVVERVLARIDRSDPDACWIWPGALFGTGYGHVAWQVNNEQFHRGVHRVVYMALVGPIPAGFDLDHICHDPGVCRPAAAKDCPHRRCCNPAHLEPVDRQTNLLRGGTVAAERAARTHCPRGHPYDETNTRRDKLGRRSCRTCTRERNREWHARNREHRAAYNREYRERRKRKT